MSMNSLRVKVHIPKPCSENWEAMLPAERGRYCLNCQKTVVDFTQKTDAEILAYLSNQGYTCGRFTSSQVLAAHELPKSFLQQWKTTFATAALFIGTKLAVITPAFAQKSAITTLSASQAIPENKTPIFEPDGNLHLRGTVLDPLDEKPIAGVMVFIKLGNRSPEIKKDYRYGTPPSTEFDNATYRTLTDTKGQFELAVPAVDLGDDFSYLFLQLKGYNQVVKQIFYQTSPQPMVLYLDKVHNQPLIGPERRETIIMGGIGGGVQQYDRRVYYRKPYRTRIGFIISKATYPFWWTKTKFLSWRDERDYS